MLDYRYAEKYSIQPQDVPKVVTVRAWFRWLMLERAEASRDLWLRYWNAEDQQAFIRDSTDVENELRVWAALKDEY